MDCHYNIISGNTVNNNTYNGIKLSESNNNKVLGNTVNYNNEYGIYLYLNSNNNTVSGNELIGNSNCIKERESEGNIFENNGSCNYKGEDKKLAIPGINLFFLVGIICIISLILLKSNQYSRKTRKITIN